MLLRGISCIPAGRTRMTYFQERSRKDYGSKVYSLGCTDGSSKI